MSFPKKAKVKIAAPSTSYPHNYDHTHIMTSDYFKIGVNFNLPVPTDNKLEMRNRSFCRLMPMAVPSFAQATIQQRLYFIPFKIVQKSYNDMVEGKPHAYDSNYGTINIPNTYRYANVIEFIKFFKQTGMSTVSTNNTYDFDSYENGAYEHRNFTDKGRQLYNLLYQLGIKIDLTIDITNTAKLYNVNVMAILAYCKVILDYYWIQVYEDMAKYEIEGIITTNSYGLEVLSNIQISKLLQFMLHELPYDNDYFTSAWDNPVGPANLNAVANITMEDITIPNISAANKSKVVTNAINADGTPIVQSNTVAVNSFSQYIDTALKRVTDYITRNRLVGSRIVDRFLARFGIKLNDEELNRVAYCGDYSYNIQFGDVMSNADTSGASLGDYAGKGFGYGESDKFEHYNKEAGIYIGITYVIPKIGYYQGTDRFSMCINRTDFWTPEFDNLGVDAISQAEILQPMHQYAGYKYEPINQIFGYQPRYTWMKKKLDLVSGEFLFDSRNNGLNAWHLMRELDQTNFQKPGGDTDVKHSMTFMLSGDRLQYDRNFGTSKGDNFYIINAFHCTCYNKMLPIYDTYDFDSRGKEILMNVGGKIENK